VVVEQQEPGDGERMVVEWLWWWLSWRRLKWILCAGDEWTQRLAIRMK